MQIIEEKQNEIFIFKLAGRLDSNTSPGFEEKVVDAIESGFSQMIIDFEKLEYLSSAGLRVILKTTKDLKRTDGKLVLCSMADYVKEVFEISGFDSFLPIVSTRADALNMF
ncbi:STAS domain-containing protein [Thermodesulfobacteriota bacterium]